jgi:hypothetical protein
MFATSSPLLGDRRVEQRSQKDAAPLDCADGVAPWLLARNP